MNESLKLHKFLSLRCSRQAIKVDWSIADPCLLNLQFLTYEQLRATYTDTPESCYSVEILRSAQRQTELNFCFKLLQLPLRRTSD